MKKRLPRPLLWMTRVLALGLIGVMLLFVGSNVFLGSQFGNDWVEKKLTRRAPALTWSHEKVTWSPWNGVVIRKLSARLKNQPQAPPLLSLEEGTIRPYWKDALRGKRVFREVVCSQPIVNLPIEALLIPAKPTTPQNTVAEVPPTAESSPAPDAAPAQAPTQPQRELPKTPPPTSQKGPAPQPQEKPKPPPRVAKPIPPADPPADPRLWLRMKDAKVRLYSLSSSFSASFVGLDVNLPLAGPETEGSVSWQKVICADREIVAATTLPIGWKDGVWSLPQHTLQLCAPSTRDESSQEPFELLIGGELAIRAKGRPFRFQSYFPAQDLAETVLHQESGATVGFQQASANFSASGRLTDPNSWQFDSLATASQVQIFSKLRGDHFTFDTAQARVLLRQATLRVPAAELRSERLSLMGNGQLQLGGYTLGVLRVVAAPEYEEALTRIAIGSFLSRGWTSHWLSPLETPDRYYRDFHIEGLCPDPQINVGKRLEFIPFSVLQSLMKQFYQQELAEEPLPTS